MTEEVKTEQETTTEQSTQEQQTEQDTQTSTTDKSETDIQQDKEDAKEAKQAGVDVDEFERTRKALEKANKEAAERRHKLKEWDELGVDPDKVKQMLQEQREAEIKKAEEEGRYQELLDKMREDMSRKEQELNKKVSTMQTKLEKQLKEKEVTAAINAEDGVTTLLKSHVEKFVDLSEGENGYETVVKDENGQVRTNEDGSNMTVRQLVQSFKNDPELSFGFKAPKVSGNGTQESNASPRTAPKKSRSKMTAREKSSYVDKYGMEAYQKLPM